MNRLQAVTSPVVEPLGKYFMVGKPVTEKREPRSLCASASTFAITVSEALAYSWPAEVHSGSSCLQ